MTGRVDQVQFVSYLRFLIPDPRSLIPEIDRHRMHLNRDSPFAFQVHVVKHLGAEFARGNRPGLEEELVGQRALAVVDVGNDREIANVAGRRHVTREKTVYLSSAVYWF